MLPFGAPNAHPAYHATSIETPRRASVRFRDFNHWQRLLRFGSIIAKPGPSRAALKSTFDEPLPQGNEDKGTKMQISRKIREVDRKRKVLVSRILLAASLTLPAATAIAQTQTNLFNYVQHVIIVIQENRTPTNLFQQDQTLINNGAHLVSQGFCGPTPEDKFSLLPVLLGTCYDTQHNHGKPTSAGTRLGGQYGISQNASWPYADYFAMDYDVNNWATTYSLSDFFDFSQSGYHSFTPINSWKYREDCFHHPGDSGCFPNYPADPDNDANETD